MRDNENNAREMTAKESAQARYDAQKQFSSGAGQGCATTAPSNTRLDMPCRVPIRERALNTGVKAEQEAIANLRFVDKLDSPSLSGAELLDLVQTAIDLGYITPRY